MSLRSGYFCTHIIGYLFLIAIGFSTHRLVFRVTVLQKVLRWVRSVLA